MTKAILGLFLLVGAVELQALSVRFPKFGTPVAIEDRVVFTSVDGLRLVSIAREDGKRIWEKRYGGDKITAWFPTEAGVLLTSESKVLACDVISGELHLLSESGLEHCSLERLGPNLILCAGETGKVDQVMLFDIGEKQERWRRPFAIRSLCRSGDTICVQEGRRKYNTSRGFHFTDVRIAAVDMKTGTNRWVHSLPKNPDFPDAIVVDEYVVVHDEEGLIICLESKSGHIVSSRLYKRGADHIAVALCAYGTNALVWTQESINVVYSLSIPKLEQTRLFHPDWYAAKAIVIAGVLLTFA